MSDKEIAFHVLKADRRDRLSELDLSNHLLLVVPQLDESVCITCYYEFLAIVNVD